MIAHLFAAGWKRGGDREGALEMGCCRSDSLSERAHKICWPSCNIKALQSKQ